MPRSTRPLLSVFCPMGSFFFLQVKQEPHAEGATWGEQGFQVAGVRQGLERRPGDGSLCLS